MKLFVYGAGGFGREIYDVARRANARGTRWDELCFIDDAPGLAGDFYGTTLYTLEDALAKFGTSELEVSIGIGEPAIREEVYSRLKARGVRLATVVDPSAIVIDTATLGEGVVVTAHCLVASQAVLGANVALNVQAIIGHDIRLGAHSVVSSMVNVGGACVVGERSYLGMGVQIKQGLTIGRDVIVGMGSVVYDSIADEVIALGNPARAIKKNESKRVFTKPF